MVDKPSINQSLVEQLHITKTKLVMYVTGGGSQAISDILAVPGASSTLLEACVPYATSATQELLGTNVASYCSQETAGIMAKRAYERAVQLTAPGSPVIGLSCTAALRTGRDKKGDHRVHIACHTGGTTATYDITLAKNARSRSEEEAVCGAAILSVASFHSGVPPAAIPLWPDFPGLLPSDAVGRSTSAIGDPVQALLEGHVRCVEFSGPREERHAVVDAPRVGSLVLPGSFNPLHDGHRQLLEAAHRAVGQGCSCIYELTIRNADKGTITREEISKRLQPFEEQGLPIVLTDATLYTNKAALFQGGQFVLGYDTAVRLVMEKYYDNSEAKMAADFAQLTAAGCSFVVGGRVDGNTGNFLGLEDINVPSVLKHVGVKFVGIPEDEFRLDISSTELRRAASGK